MTAVLFAPACAAESTQSERGLLHTEGGGGLAAKTFSASLRWI